MSGIEVLAAEVWWGDGYENWPSLTFLLDRMPRWEVYERRPCAAGALSAEQEAIAGGARAAAPTPGWHVYHSEDDGFAWFFTWGGKPDDGFGGSVRRVRLTDGSEAEVVGGWHAGGDVAVRAGFAPCLDVGVRTTLVAGERLAGGTACFVTEERFEAEVARLLPDVEVCRHPSNRVMTVKWRGQPSKAEFMAVENERRRIVRERLAAKYHDRSWHGGDWYRKASRAELAELAELDTRPYSALGPLAVTP